MDPHPKDQLGQQILTFLETRQINTSSISCSDQYPTGTVQIQLDSSGHPQFEICVDSAWDFIPWSGMLALLASTTDAVCYGTLSQRNQMSRDTIQRFLESLPSNCLRILDVNLREVDCRTGASQLPVQSGFARDRRQTYLPASGETPVVMVGPQILTLSS